MKAAYITPIYKKSDMYPMEAKSYPPISNLSVLSKLLERLVSQQIVTYLKDNGLLPKLQWAFRAYHSTETAVLKGEFNVKDIMAQNEHLCLVKWHTLHESDNSGEITTMFADKIIYVQTSG